MIIIITLGPPEARDSDCAPAGVDAAVWLELPEELRAELRAEECRCASCRRRRGAGRGAGGGAEPEEAECGCAPCQSRRRSTSGGAEPEEEVSPDHWICSGCKTPKKALVEF